jgi:hypothetical protein
MPAWLVKNENRNMRGGKWTKPELRGLVPTFAQTEKNQPHTQNKTASPMVKIRIWNLQNQSINANYPTAAVRMRTGNMKES